jgi:hypothetical protein
MDQAQAPADVAVGFGTILFVLILVALAVVPYWKIWTRTGHSGLWALLMLVPIVNLVSLWVLAYKRWPALDDGAAGRRG